MQREVKKLEQNNRGFRWTVVYTTNDAGTDVTLALVMSPVGEDAGTIVHVLSDEAAAYRTLHAHDAVVEQLAERLTAKLNPEPAPEEQPAEQPATT